MWILKDVGTSCTSSYFFGPFFFFSFFLLGQIHFCHLCKPKQRFYDPYLEKRPHFVYSEIYAINCSMWCVFFVGCLYWTKSSFPRRNLDKNRYMALGWWESDSPWDFNARTFAWEKSTKRLNKMRVIFEVLCFVEHNTTNGYIYFEALFVRYDSGIRMDTYFHLSKPHFVENSLEFHTQNRLKSRLSQLQRLLGVFEIEVLS